MQKTLLAFLTICLTLTASVGAVEAQILDPVDWSFEARRTAPDAFDLVFTADIDPDWWVYSQDVGEGPIPTTFSFEEADGYALDGATSEDGAKVKEGIDPMFDVNVKKFADQAVFTQRVTITQNTTVTGSFEFMTCDDERCLPPEIVDFSFDLTLATDDAETSPAADPDPEDETGAAGEVGSETDGGVEWATGWEEAGRSIHRDETGEGIIDPVHWSVTSYTRGDSIRLAVQAVIDDGWSVYSEEVGDGPVPTTFGQDEHPAIRSWLATQEVSDHTKEGIDPVFETFVKKFTHDVTFVRTAVLSGEAGDGPVTCWFEFMTCNDETCLPPAMVEFSLDPTDGSVAFADAADQTTGQVNDPQNEEVGGTCDRLVLGIDADASGMNGGDDGASQSAWTVFLLGLVGGLLALLTPCVFPMIPLTVSFFTKSSGGRGQGIVNAVLYGFFIFMIYVLLSAPFHIMNLSPDILNEIATNVWLNLAFFVIFVVFAFSFFGFYELTIPSSVANRVSAAESTGGIIGTFFMALTLAIVSFSCTGPIIGSLLAGTLTQGAWNLTAGMAGFGVALGLPFALFALFPGVMNSLPKSGGWLNSVKVVLGFIELALAVKFLSNADLVAHWGILKREVFFAIWILIGLLITLYILGIIKFPHDTPVQKRGPVRLALAALFLGFTLWITPGLFGRNIDLLSGFPPPMYYSLVDRGQSGVDPEVMAEYGMSDACPHDLPCFKDYFKAVRYARDVNKPLLIDFTGYACVNCRKMEENVWPKENILEILGEDVVLVSLYVDDKERLPEDEQCTGVYADYTKEIRTVGNKWSFFEIVNFASNAQPLYVMLDPSNTHVLMPPTGYTPDAAQYRDLLLDGLATFEAKAMK